MSGIPSKQADSQNDEHQVQVITGNVIAHAAVI
jgi:hypothetical protein